MAKSLRISAWSEETDWADAKRGSLPPNASQYLRCLLDVVLYLVPKLCDCLRSCYQCYLPPFSLRWVRTVSA